MAASDDSSVSNQVLLKLVIRGMDPAEVTRLAEQTYGQLKVEAAQHIDALTAYYKQSQAAQDDAAKASADEKIAAETKALDAVTKLMRQQEIEANKARNAWHGIMEDLENITTVATGAFKVISEGFELLKRASEEIIKDTNIYNSLKGSIDEMRMATQGQVADIDLISAKNRGLEKELNLTDAQFGLVAAAATKYAHAIGTDVKSALDTMIDGLATGRARTLQHAGVVVDAAEANQKWAEKMGLTVDQITAQDKLLAFQTEALEKMKEKMSELEGGSDTLAERMERGFVRIKNAVTEAAAAIGNIDIGRIIDPFTAFANDNAAASAATHKRISDAYDADHAQFDRPDDSSKPYLPGVGPTDADRLAGQKNKVGINAYQRQEEKQRQSGAASFDAFIGTLGNQQGPKSVSALNPDDELASKATLTGGLPDTEGMDAYVKASEAANAADEKRFITMEKIKGLTVDSAQAYQKLADSIGVEVEQLTHEEKMAALEKESQVQMEALQKKLKKEADARRAELKATSDKAGMLGVFLWGTAGPEQTYKEMDAFQQHMIDTMGGVSNVLASGAQQLSGAIGQSLAASISGAAGHKKSMKEMTHDVLESIAEQALIKAVWEAAEGVASIAMYNFPGAALHFAAAAAYGAVGVAAGLGARALNTPSAPASASASPGMTSQSTNQGASGSRSSASPSSTTAAPVTINMTVMPGGEADAGRSVKRALDALSAQTGQPLLAS